MAMTLQELKQVLDALIYRDDAARTNAIKTVSREIRQMEQDEILSESKANPT